MNASPVNERLSAAAVAALLADLYGQEFGGKRLGKYRISRKYVRQLAGRQRLTPDFINELGDELFERGFVIADLETFFAVLDHRLFNSYRRVPSTAIGNVNDGGARTPSHSQAPDPSQRPRGEDEGRGNANGRG